MPSPRGIVAVVRFHALAWTSRAVCRRALVAVLMISAATGCAGRARVATPEEVMKPTGVPARPADAQGVAIPPGVGIDDGLTQEEAVAVALWNNPDFQAAADRPRIRARRPARGRAAAESGAVAAVPGRPEAARSDAAVADRGPVGAAAPRRARRDVALDRVAAGLEQYGLNLVADVKIGVRRAGSRAGSRRLADEAATELERCESAHGVAPSAPATSASSKRAPRPSTRRARGRMRSGRGSTSSFAPTPCAARLGLALEIDRHASHADRRRPETPVQSRPACSKTRWPSAARRPRRRDRGRSRGARIGWERSRILALTAVLDANGAGQKGSRRGPGSTSACRSSNRNQGGRCARAQAELQRAGRRIRRRAPARRDRAGATRRCSIEQARSAASGWRDTVVDAARRTGRASPSARSPRAMSRISSCSK